MQYTLIALTGSRLLNSCRSLIRLTVDIKPFATMTGANNGTFFSRLPKSVIPKNYAIEIKPDLKALTFAGREIVQVDVVEATSKIILNSLSLNVSKGLFKTKDGKEQNAKITVDDKREIVDLNFASAISVGPGVLELTFDGVLSDKMKGFYRSKYQAPDGQERYAAVTQFEPTDARRCFPCWDEPALKATFDMTLIVPKDRVALSNTNEVSNKADPNDSNLKVVKFATTPIMSTYLVAIVVGEFEFIEGKTSEGLQVRVFTPVGKTEQGVFALDVATKAVPFYSGYFGIPYPLPKLDLIAIADFSAGAMENWGLVTYRESCLLVDPQNTSSLRKQWIGLVVAHEIAHMWFGNLVTMEWWTDLWLNEGFATFMEFLCIDNLFPEYNIWTQFVTDTYTPALALDALHNSHPIEVPVGNPSEIDEIFDEISYHKGASVIRMLHRYISNEFSKGVSLYLNRHKYKNSFTEDLWNALTESSNKPIRNVMSTWTKQKGFPVISVTARQEGSDRILSLSQEKFCADGKLPETETEMMWMIPINISTSTNPKDAAVETLMESRTLEVVVPNVAANEWVKLNPGTVGFYRVQYSPEMLSLLLPSVQDQSLPPLDRLGLQNDLFAMVQSGRTSTVEILKLMSAFVNEDNYTVWCSINSCLGRLNSLLSHTDFQELLHRFGRQLFQNVYARLGWDPIPDEPHFDTLLRSLVLSRLASFDEPSVIEESNKRFDAHVNKIALIPADLRSCVFQSVAAHSVDRFETFFKLYRETDLHEEKNRIGTAMALVRDEVKIRKVLEFALSSDVRNQDSVFIIGTVAHTRNGRDLAWQFFKENSDELKRRYEGGFLTARLVKSCTENFASEEKAQEIEAFFAQNHFPGTERSVQQAVETIRLNAAWLARDSNAIRQYLAAYS